MITVETQETPTGRWIPVVSYSPGNIQQLEEAHEKAKELRFIGLEARVTVDGEEVDE